jgi:hypothetical protein
MRVRSLFLLLAQPELERLYDAPPGINNEVTNITIGDLIIIRMRCF